MKEVALVATSNLDLNLNNPMGYQIGNPLFKKILSFFFLLFYLKAPALALTNDSFYISDIEISGLYSISEQELLYLLDIKKGEILDKKSLRSGIKRAFLKGIFDDIIIIAPDECNIKEKKCRVRIEIKEKPIINSIIILGDNHFSKKFIRTHLTISEKERLNYVKIKKGIEYLNREIGKRGFPNADISYEIRPAKANRVDIIIKVSEGEPELIKKLVITEPNDIVKSYLRLSEGSIFDQTEIERAIDNVKKYYKKRGIVGTSISYLFQKGILSIDVKLGKKLNILFNGNKAIKTKELLKEAPFFEQDELSDDLIELYVSRMLSLYHNKGYIYAQIATTIKTTDEDITLEFYIFEGESFIVNSIEIEGVTIDRDRFKEVMSLKVGGYYNPNVIESDIRTITAFYNALGYLNVEVKEPEIIINDRSVKIKFFINEGNQTIISNILFYGNQTISENDILREIPIRITDPYNEVDIAASRRKILEKYNKKGFLNTTVTVDIKKNDTFADIIFYIDEGDITYFGKSVIVGNEKTKYEVIKRGLIKKESSPFDYSILMKERQRLHRVGLFSDIDIKALDQEDSKRDVLYKLSEAKAGAIEIAIGYAEYERFRGLFDISYRNLWGLNKYGSFRTELSTLEQRFILTYLDQYFIDERTHLKSALLYENKKEINIDTKEMRYRVKRTSASIGIERELNELLKADLSYNFLVTQTFDVKPDVILSREDTGTLIISGIRTGLIYDSRDNPFDPKRGILTGTSFTLASNIFFSETDFAKLIFYFNNYQSLSKRIVLAFSLKGGIAQGFRKTRELPLTERFFLGGRTTVRGFQQDTLGPKGADGTPIGGNSFGMASLELRTEVGKGLGIVGFLDAGNVWLKTKDIDINDIRYTTGLGLRYTTPVGPIRIDYGHKLDKKRGESRGEIHFSIGHAF